MRFDGHLGIEIAKPVARRFELRPPDVAGSVEHLPMQVRGIDDVEVDESDPADAGCREVDCGRAAESARADDEHGSVLEAQLPRLADLGKHDVPRVAGAFRGSEHEKR